MAAVGQRSLSVRAVPARGLSETPGYRLELTLLPRLGLTFDGKPVEITLRSQRVLALLAIERSRISRSYLAGTLWPDGPEERASASLRSALWMLPHGLPGIVIASGQHLELSPHVRVDYHAAMDLGSRLVGGDTLPDQHFPDERLLWHDLLTEWSEDWLLVEQERFRQMRLHGLEMICARLVADGMAGRAIQTALRTIAAEPLRESSHRALVRAHLAEGNLGEALRQCRLFERLLRDELGIDPSPEFQRMTERLLPDAGGRRASLEDADRSGSWVTAR
jgi:DNA-binding SARP family transcriptional activator